LNQIELLATIDRVCFSIKKKKKKKKMTDKDIAILIYARRLDFVNGDSLK